MKKLIIFLIPFLVISPVINAQMVISSNGSDSEPSAILFVNSNNKGFLPPRMAAVHRNVISSPAEGLFLYQTDFTKGYYYYDGISWKSFISSSVNMWSVTGNSGTTDGVNFIGTTDNVPLIFRVNDSVSGRIDNGRMNSFLGYRASTYLMSGYASDFNAGIGYEVMSEDTRFSRNCAMGAGAATNFSTAYYNIAIGAMTLHNNEKADDNIAVGYKTLYHNTNAEANIAVGARSLFHLSYQNSDEEWESKNIAVGMATMFYLDPSDNTSGKANVAIGDSAMFGKDTGDRNGTCNTVLGYQAMYSTDGADSNSSAGYQSLYNISSGKFNVAMGYKTLYNLTGGEGNTAAGWSAGTINTDSTTETYNTSIGFYSSPENNMRDNTINIRGLGYGNVHIDGDNQAAFGNSDMTSIGGQVAWTTISDKRVKRNIENNVPGLSFIKKLEPVTYNFKKSEVDIGNKPVYRKNREIVHTGMFAQDVNRAAQSIGYDFDGIDKPENPDGRWGLRYALFTVPLIKAVQENQHLIEKTQKSIETAENSFEDLNELEKEISKVKQLINQR